MQLHRELADKLERDAQHLQLALQHDQEELALSIVKRMRRHATALIQELARRRSGPP